eukprot:gene9827-biopygen10773
MGAKRAVMFPLLEPGSLREPTPHGHDTMSVSGDFSRVARASSTRGDGHGCGERAMGGIKHERISNRGFAAEAGGPLATSPAVSASDGRPHAASTWNLRGIRLVTFPT